MKRLLLLLLPFFIACSMRVPDLKADRKKLSFSAQLGGWTRTDSVGTIFIKTTLFNNSLDTLIYFRMDCSWPDSYTTDNDSFNVIKSICYKNGPMTRRLLPFQSEDEYIRLTTKVDIQNWRRSKFRIGFNFHLLDSTKDVVYNVSRLTDMQNILWSDTLELSKFWKAY